MFCTLICFPLFDVVFVNNKIATVLQGTMYGVIKQLAHKIGGENIKTSDPVSVIQVHWYSIVIFRENSKEVFI